MNPLRRSPFPLLSLVCALTGGPVLADHHLMQIEQVIAGVNGDVSAQAVQLRMRASFQNIMSHGRLRAWDAAGGNPVMVLDFLTDVPNHGAGVRVLVLSAGMAQYLDGAANADYLMTTPIPPAYLTAGSLTFEDNLGTIWWRVSWGGADYTGSGSVNGINDAQLDGTMNPPFPSAVPYMTTQALATTLAATAKGTSALADYTVTPGNAVLTNNAGTARTVVGLPGCAIYPGLDLFTTPGTGSSYQDFAPMPIPAGFFDPGSDPFEGQVVFQGEPLAPFSPFGPTDTIVRRGGPGLLPNPGDGATVPIEIVALHLVSAQPITVTYNGGSNPEQWQVGACLSSAAPQQAGSMDVRRGACDCAEGGTFTSTLPVLPRLVFSRSLPTPAVRVLDFGALALPPIVFQTTGRWMPADPGFDLVTVPAGLSVDHDCEPGSPPVGNLPPTTGFFAGLFAEHCASGTCFGPPVRVKRLTLEQAAFAAHGVIPAQTCLTGDADLDGVCDDADNCPGTSNPLQEDPEGDGIGDACDNCPVHPNTCQEDANGNGLGDACDLSGIDWPVAGSGLQLGAPSPNPAAGALSYSVSLERAAHVRVTVYSLAGRLVRTLVDRELPAGVHLLSWDARRGADGPPASGVYYLRLTADGVRRTRTFTLLR